jgi:hypothetical protein
MGVAPKCHFFEDSQVKSHEIFEIENFAILEAHKFLCKLLIEARSKANLWNSTRNLEQYVAHHLQACNLGRFLTFSGRESN